MNELNAEIEYSLLQENIDKDAIIAKLLEKDDETDKYKRIRCPHCNWQPNASSKWFCSDCDYPEYFYGGCFTEWNTFDTKGFCPGCSHKWLWTSCLSCSNWALHEDWYVKDIQK